MKKLFLLAVLSFLPIVPVSVKAQQTNVFETCTQYREHYIPGGYDRYGDYYPGRIETQEFTVDCYDKSRVIYRNSPRYYNNRRYNYYATPTRYYYCNPTRSVYGALLGGSIGRALTSTRNNRRNRRWATGLGAALGGLAYSC